MFAPRSPAKSINFASKRCDSGPFAAQNDHHTKTIYEKNVANSIGMLKAKLGTSFVKGEGLQTGILEKTCHQLDNKTYSKMLIIVFATTKPNECS